MGTAAAARPLPASAGGGAAEEVAAPAADLSDEALDERVPFFFDFA